MGRASAIVDYLVREGYTDPKRLVASGTSRGGFLALELAAADDRFCCIAAISPVTDLLVLKEFAGLSSVPDSLVLESRAEALAGRAVWIAIGNNDRRVSTDSAIRFSRSLVMAALAKNRIPRVDLHVVRGVPNARGHLPHATAAQDAAAWIRKQLLELDELTR